MHQSILATAAGLFLAVGTAYGHSDGEHAPKTREPSRAEQKAFGIAADPKKATRTLTIAMNDRMHFTPDVLTIRSGETVRFVVKNEGKLLHELVLGTEEELARHAELMRQFPDMEHDEPHMVHVGPGRSGDLAWTFNRPGVFHFACLVGGHFEAGMKGRIVVR